MGCIFAMHMPFMMKTELTRHDKLQILFEDNFNEHQKWRQDPGNVGLLVATVNLLRPKEPEKIAEVTLLPFLTLLKSNRHFATNFSAYLNGLIKKRKFAAIITDAGILNNVDFFYEVRKRIFAKFLPEQPNINTLEYILNQVFYKDTDPLWIKKIPEEQVDDLFNLLNFSTLYDGNQRFEMRELLFSMAVITHRICGRALERDVIKMVPEYESLESPFLAYQAEFLDLRTKILETQDGYINPENIDYKQVTVLLAQCLTYIDDAFYNSSKYGISLRVNQSLLMIKQQLMRLKELLPLLTVSPQRTKKSNTIQLALKLISYNCHKNNIRTLLGQSTELLSYEITQHTAKTGEHYITNTRSEYFKMFKTAAGGGLIVGVLCIVKVLLSKIETSDFGHAFLYSMNYAMGFIAIYVFGFTLATKQPAMTASTLAKALEEGLSNTSKSVKEIKYDAFARLFARLFRSQFIAFVGNVIIAFPVSLLGIWLIDKAINYNIAANKWEKLLSDLSPIDSPAIFHASIAGFFLFLSGIIAGSVANRNRHNNIYHRIAEHPFLKLSFGEKKAKKIAGLFERKWAGIVSNFWFGVFMGSTASVGIFLGLNLDIRHITFASGNLALGLYGAGFSVTPAMLFWGITGIGVIGLMNFLVSFTLSLLLAFRSRSIPLKELKQVAISIKHHFTYSPLKFFYPPKERGLQ